MCNQVAMAVHCRPGEEVVCDRTSHILCYEGGGLAATAGVNAWPIDGDKGLFTAAQVRAAVRMPMRHVPRQKLLAVEQTSNLGGGAVWPLAQLREVCAVAREHGMATHMDGARLMNAVVASGVSAAEQCATFDSGWIDFSKGLGAPIGAALAGSKAFISEAWRVKQRLGGAMRQAGIVAAAALYSLDHNVERLASAIAFCREHLAHYKCPTSVEIRDELPRTATGKLQKYKLREPYWEGRRGVA